MQFYMVLHPSDFSAPLPQCYVTFFTFEFLRFYLSAMPSLPPCYLIRTRACLFSDPPPCYIIPPFDARTA
jgi:hypothetical protein